MIDEDIENGCVGSGNFGHAGRPGKVGGSAPYEKGFNKEKKEYGQKVRDTWKQIKTKTYSTQEIEDLKKHIEKTREQTIQKAKARLEELANQKSKRDIKREKSEAVKEKATQGLDKMGAKIIKETHHAKLIEKDGKSFWIPNRLIREDGSLTPKGQQILEQAPKTEDFKKQQEEQREAKKHTIISQDKIIKETDGAIQFKRLFRTLKNNDTKEYGIWVPKSLCQKTEDGDYQAPRWFVDNKIKELEYNYPLEDIDDWEDVLRKSGIKTDKKEIEKLEQKLKDNIQKQTKEETPKEEKLLTKKEETKTDIQPTKQTKIKIKTLMKQLKL